MKISDIRECVDANKTPVIMNSTLGFAFTIRLPQPSEAEAINRISISRRWDIVRSAGWLGVRQQVKRHEESGVGKYGALIEASTDYPLRNFGRVALFGNASVGYTFAEVQSDNDAIKYCGLAVDYNYEDYGVGTALEYLRLKWAKLVDLPIRALIDPENGKMRRILEEDGFQQVGTEGPSADLPLCFDVLELSRQGVISAIDRFDSQVNIFSFSPSQTSR